MNEVQKIVIILTLFGCFGCQAQSNTKMVTNNPLICDLDSGSCEMPIQKTNIEDLNLSKKATNLIKIIYYTDPICSSCWGIEPQLRKLKLEYGTYIEVEYRMGGLLPDWSYNSGGISKPADVAQHWDEVSGHYDMPIDGDIWLEDPLDSSYPPSIAFKAAQLQDQKMAILLLRELREMVFLQKKNIAKWEYLELAAAKVGLNKVQFKADYTGAAKIHFEQDLKMGKELGVRGFPTLFFIDAIGNKEIVYGAQPYSTFEQAFLKLLPTSSKTNYDKTWASLFSKYQTLTAREFSTLAETPRKDSENYLNELTLLGKLEKFTIKNGSIWKLK